MRINKLCQLLHFGFTNTRHYCQILGISLNATKDQIKSAYFRKAKEHHPDTSGTKSDAKFNEVRKAYQYLSTSLSAEKDKKNSQQPGPEFRQEARKKKNERNSTNYDQFDQSEFYDWQESQFDKKSRKQYQQNAEFEFEDQKQLREFIKAFKQYLRNGYVKPKHEKFRPFMHASKEDFYQWNEEQDWENDEQQYSDPYQFDYSPKNKSRVKKLDIFQRLKIREEQIGDEIKIKYSRQINCPKCQFNSGRNFSKMPCRDCHNKESDRSCKKCKGKGFTIKYHCKQCNNRGNITKNVQEIIIVPLGIENGQRIIVAGRGHQQKKKGKYGDLIVQIQIIEANNQKTKKRGKEQYSKQIEVQISIFEAVLGCIANVRSNQGITQIKIPPGTQHGAILKDRIGNKEQKKVKVNIAIPMQISTQEKQLFEKIRNLNLSKSTPI